jgi:hypothetical protein
MQGPPKFIQIAIFGLKMHHLATLAEERSVSFDCAHLKSETFLKIGYSPKDTIILK